MKKILVFAFFVALFFSQSVLATDNNQSGAKQKISFIYINGSNDYKSHDRSKFKEHFTRQVSQMHPYMMNAFTKDKLIHKNLLKNGQIEINPEPVVFYWGDKSMSQVQNIDDDLAITNKFSPMVSQIVRSTFAHCLHDAVWVQKHQNMSVIIDELHQVVKNETDKGNQVVLFGYSAGSFITYQYFLNKFISLEPDKLTYKNENPKVTKVIADNPAKKTCLDALIESDIVRLDLYGKYSGNPNFNVVTKNYPQLDKYTNTSCFSDETVKGVVNFASPLALFYSQVSDSKSDLNFLSKLMYKHILETDVFWLTVNYTEDPLGFPASKNMTKKELEDLSLGKVSFNGGFVYDKYNVSSRRTFMTAHLAYWDTQKRFVKGVVQAYNEGYNNLYKNLVDPGDNQESL